MTIGFLIAMENEYEPFLDKLGKIRRVEKICGAEFCLYDHGKNTVVLAKSGIGEIAAASAASILISRYDCDRILNFGLVGGLTDLSLGEVVAVRDVVHYDCDITPFGYELGAAVDTVSPYLPADNSILPQKKVGVLPMLRLASGDKFIADEERKAWLLSQFSADICDMEEEGGALTCTRADVPFTMIKVVSDGADSGAVLDFKASKMRAFDMAISVVLFVLEAK